MLIAEAFAGKSLYHSTFNPQGMRVSDLENYGAKRCETGFVFPDQSEGYFRENGTWKDGDTKWTFVARNQEVVEQEDELN